MQTECKVSWTYWWRHHKDGVYHFLEVLGLILFLPLILLVSLVMLFTIGDTEEDEEWCNNHGYRYPYGESWGSHKIVRKWKRNYKEEQKRREKDEIRESILRAKKITTLNSK